MPDQGYMSPYEIWFREKPSSKKLHPFGCLAFKYIPKQQRTKLGSKSELGIFVGYNMTGYRLYMPRTGRICISRHVRFLDHVKGAISLKNEYEINNLKTMQPELFKLLDSEWSTCNDEIDSYLEDSPEDFLSEEQSIDFENEEIEISTETSGKINESENSDDSGYFYCNSNQNVQRKLLHTFAALDMSVNQFLS
jgi:hypothetical protein